jgi:GH15 family glucan-1,4-alpha-glucosidase
MTRSTEHNPSAQEDRPVPLVARPALRALAASSIALIEAHQHPSGAYPACPDYPVYRFSWLRDGAFIADAMSRAGRPESASAFFGWCARVIEARSERIADLTSRPHEIADADLLPTRFTLDGDDDHEPWWNFQLDGYGTWLWALAEHAGRCTTPVDRYAAAVASTVDYLIAFGTRPCFDWWEEHTEYRHTSTLGAVAAGLRSAETLISGTGEPLLGPDRAARAGASADRIDALLRTEAVHDGHLIKWLGGTSVDGSLLACITAFGTAAPGSALAERTYDEVRRQLCAGGVYRYLGDTFYGGGEWINLTAWLGWYETLTGRHADAMSRLDWIADRATAEGLLPEQVSDNAQDASYIPEWTERWGSVATPLLWSHAMFLTLAVSSGVWSEAC